MQEISRAELGKHVERDDMWIAINGKVYDVSKFLMKHPGSPVVMGFYKGQDATDAFHAFHSTDSETRERVGRIMDALQIGVLVHNPLPDSDEASMLADFRSMESQFQKDGLFKVLLFFFNF